MKRMSVIFLLILISGSCLSAQPRKGQAYMQYRVMDGDTVYFDQISPAWVFPKGSRVDRTSWKKYCKLVYNFNQVYPYALLGKDIVWEADTYIEQHHLNRIQKEKYISLWQDQLLSDFEDVVRHMTISQGQLLVRLVDREVGKTSFKIVKDYTNGVAAGFWQGVARIFGQNLKRSYDPTGADRQTEELVRKWEEGSFDELYFSLFWEYPPKISIPSKYRKGESLNQESLSRKREPHRRRRSTGE